MAKITYQGSEQFRPLSPWAYFGYMFLFSLPVAGIILLIVYSFNDSNINRRNFARSYWCVYVLAAIFVAIALAAGVGSLIAGAAASPLLQY